jgi:hypothetical protein
LRTREHHRLQDGVLREIALVAHVDEPGGRSRRKLLIGVTSFEPESAKVQGGLAQRG